MNDTDTTPNSYLGIRIAVGVAALILLALIGMLGSVAMKQSATTEALETREAQRETAPSPPTQE